jgi:HSP20 family molecular chaperone IbpA
MIYRSLFGGPTYDFEKVLEMLNYDKPTYRTTKITTQSKDSHEINYTKDGAYLFFEAPGFNKTTLKVEVENGIIHIQGSRTYKLNGEEKTKSIEQQFTIGADLNPESIEATIEDGLLTVFIPNFKKQEKKRVSLL